MEELKIDGQTLTYESLGEGEPLLFVNNIAVSSSSMRGLAPFFNRAGYQLVLYDHLGPDDNTTEQIASRTGQLLDHLDVRPWVLGISAGACIAQELALQRPDRVRATVLISTRGRRSAFLNLYQEAFETLVELGSPEFPMMLLTFLMMFPPAALNDDATVENALASMKGMVESWEDENLKRSLAVQKAYDNRLDALSGIVVPCLVIAFELDVNHGARQGQEVAKAIPGCEYVEIPGAAHGGPMTHTPAVFGAALDFLTKVKGRASGP